MSESSFCVVECVDDCSLCRLVMGCSAVFYVLFIGLHLYPKTYVLIIVSSLHFSLATAICLVVADLLFIWRQASVLIGISASTLWTAQGSFMSRHANETNYGLVSGVFFMIFSLTVEFFFGDFLFFLFFCFVF